MIALHFLGHLGANLLHGYDGSLDEFAVTTDGKMPGSDAHQVVEGEFQDETTVRANLNTNAVKQEMGAIKIE